MNDTLTEIRHLLYNKDISKEERDGIEKVLLKYTEDRKKGKIIIIHSYSKFFSNLRGKFL